LKLLFFFVCKFVVSFLIVYICFILFLFFYFLLFHFFVWSNTNMHLVHEEEKNKLKLDLASFRLIISECFVNNLHVRVCLCTLMWINIVCKLWLSMNKQICSSRIQAIFQLKKQINSKTKTKKQKWKVQFNWFNFTSFQLSREKRERHRNNKCNYEKQNETQIIDTNNIVQIRGQKFNLNECELEHSTQKIKQQI
jgi:hypothetical protein